MPAMKKLVLASTATLALAAVPVTPAAAAGPLFLAPWAFGHIVLPLLAAASAASQAPAPYGVGPAYYSGGPAYAPGPGNYYGRPSYYGSPAAYYPPGYYRPSPGFRPVGAPFYGPPRGYAQARASYYGSYGGQGYSRTRGYNYRRR
jgi:hypothetical protein